MAFSGHQGRRDTSLLPGSSPGSFYTRSGIPWYWAEMCLPAPHCVFTDILLSGKHLLIAIYLATPDTTETGEWSHFSWKMAEALTEVRVSWQHSSRKAEWHGIIPGWGQKFMLQCGLHRHCGCMYRVIGSSRPAEITSQFHTSFFDITILVGVGLSYYSLMTMAV